MLDCQLIRELGRREGPGRPVLFGATELFLRYFGLRDMSGLPPLGERGVQVLLDTLRRCDRGLSPHTWPRQAALRAVLQARDGRGPQTRLLPLITERLGDWPVIRRAVYGEGGRKLLASLVPLVVQAAAGHDAVARNILASAGRSLGDLAAAVARRLDMTEESIKLFTVGGVFAASELVRQPLRQALRDHNLRCRLCAPVFPPAIGAVLLAMEVAGVPARGAVVRQLKCYTLQTRETTASSVAPSSRARGAPRRA